MRFRQIPVCLMWVFIQMQTSILKSRQAYTTIWTNRARTFDANVVLVKKKIIKLISTIPANILSFYRYRREIYELIRNPFIFSPTPLLCAHTQHTRDYRSYFLFRTFHLIGYKRYIIFMIAKKKKKITVFILQRVRQKV